MGTSPGIVYACQFVTNSVAKEMNLNFADHAIGYISRDKAMLENNPEPGQEESQVNVTDGGYLGREYATNPFYNSVKVEGHKINFGYDKDDEICTGIFNADKDELNQHDKFISAKEFNLAQANDNCLYTSVISFDNDFLSKNGIDPRTGKGQKLLRECTRLGAANLLKNSQLDLDNIAWTAAIHYNTNHIHIHLDFAEIDARIREKNKLDVKAFDKLKSAVANKIIDNTCILKKLDDIMRKSLQQTIKQNAQSYHDYLTPLINKLPLNIPWEYKREGMEKYHYLINKVTDNIISADPQLHAEWINLQSELNDYREFLQDLYVEGKRNLADVGVKNKLDDFYSRTGNALLKEAKKFYADKGALQLIREECQESQGYKQVTTNGEERTDREKKSEAVFSEHDDYFNSIYKKALHGETEAVYKLGSMLENGYGTEKNIDDAMFCYEHAALAGHADAMYKIGKLTPDKNLQIDYLINAAKAGHDGAMFLLGKKYEKTDIGLSEMWYKKAGQLDNAWARLRLIKLYENNRQYFSDINDSDIEKLQRCTFINLSKLLLSNPDNDFVHYQLGNMCLNGIGTEKSPVDAVNHFNICKSENINVLHELQRLSFNNTVCSDLREKAQSGNIDAQKALDSLKAVSNDIHPFAQFSDNYSAAKEGLRNCNFDKALELMKIESATGNVYALHDLGQIYNRGLGVDKDPETAQLYYKLAFEGMKIINAQKENPYIEYRLGKMAQHGLGTGANPQQALEWYVRSADSGNKFAQYSAGSMYYTGTGCEQDYSEAKQYFESAASQDNAFASYTLGEMYVKGYGVTMNSDTAQDYYKNAFLLFKAQAEDTKDDNLQYRLGTMQRDGKGSEPNITKSIKYFELSAEQGNDNAMIALSELFADRTLSCYNPQKAIENLEYAAKTNDNAKYSLAKIYLSCPDIEKRPDKAVLLLEELAPKNPFAKYTLGCVYLDKNNPEHNIQKGTDYLKKLAEEKNNKALLRLGCFYLRSGNKELGNSYLLRAAAQGNEFAEKLLNSPHYQSKCNVLNCSTPQKEYALQKQKIRLNTERAMHRLNSQYKGHIKELQREFEYEQSMQQSLQQSERYSI